MQELLLEHALESVRTEEKLKQLLGGVDKDDEDDG
jgi:hypothetical protein